MNKVFADIFSKHPDEIIDGDYFYYNPWHDKAQDVAFAARKGITVEELKDKYKKRWLGLDFAKGSGSSFISGEFKSFWDERTFQSEFEENLNEPDIFEDWMLSVQIEIENGFSKVNEILSKIAADNKPFIDISSSSTWGFIPFIAKLNPQISCMATDIYAHLIKCLRIFINANLTQYNINLACFDNNNIPIKSNKLHYVTSTFGISSNASENSQNFINSIFIDKGKPISEVYRILKPGRCYVTIEYNKEWKFDMTKAREACDRVGKLFGVYTYNEIEEREKEGDKEKVFSWRNQFAAAGFQIEVEEKYLFKKDFTVKIRNLFHHLTDLLEIHEWTYDEKKEYEDQLLKKYKDQLLSVNRKNFNKEAEEFGIEFTEGEIFYVLRKPNYNT